MTWRQYQEDAAEFFRELGMDAKTDARIEGARGSHDIDVLVRSNRAGIDQMWVVECKKWRRRVSKLHVAALADIVGDVGADRGILLSDSGFQAGAIRLGRDRNISLTNIVDLRENAADELVELGLRECRSEIVRMRERLEVVKDYERGVFGVIDWMLDSTRSDLINQTWMPLSFAGMALDEAEVGRWPVLYGADYEANSGLRASNRSELGDGLRALIQLVEPKLQALETEVEAEAKARGVGWPAPPPPPWSFGEAEESGELPAG